LNWFHFKRQSDNNNSQILLQTILKNTFTNDIFKARPGLYKVLQKELTGSMEKSNNRSNFDIADFLWEHFDEDTYYDFFNKEFPIWDYDESMRVEIVQVLKNGNEPFIPGSSLKGGCSLKLRCFML